MNEAVDHAAVIADTSFRPGTWFGVLGEHAAVFLPPTVKDRVAPLWELVDGGSGFDELLDALIAGGLRSLPGFLILSRGEEAVRVLVRGTPRAVFLTTAGDTVEVDGADTTTWTERTVASVARTTLLLEGHETGWVQESDHHHLVSGGLVRVARVDHPPYLAAPVEADPVEADPVEAAPEPDPAPETVGEPEPDVATAEPFEAPAVAELGADPGNTEVFEPFTPPPSVGQWQPPDSGVPSDHDGQTLGSSWDSDQFARQQPGIPGQPPAPSVTARPVARLHFAHGDVIEVDRAVLVGRAPEARRFTSTDQPRLVTVPSPNQEISSTHLEIRPGSGADHGTAVVTDLGSTNGTVLVLPGLGPESLQPGVAVQLLPGALVDLGDGMTIQVSGA